MSDTVVSLRHAVADDQPFLEHLFRATRSAEFAPTEDALINELLRLQYTMRATSLANAFDPSGDHIIEHEDGPVGRIWVDSACPEWELVDLAVLPTHQNRGIASVLIGDVVDQSEQLGATVRLTVRSDNPRAQRLYFRHGFTVAEATESDLHLIRRSRSNDANASNTFARWNSPTEPVAKPVADYPADDEMDPKKAELEVGESAGPRSGS